MDIPLIVRAQLELAWNQVALIIHQEPKNGNIAFASNLMIDVVKEGSVITPTCHLRLQEAQVLMDDLWNAGLRPSQHRFSDIAFEAQGKHLNDMRRIVAKELDISL